MNDFEKIYLDETNINCLITVSSLAEDDQDLSDDLDRGIRETISCSNDIYPSKLSYERFIVNTSEEFFSVLEGISENAKKMDYYPSIHFDMHGCDRGLGIGATGELIIWDDLLPILREINKSVRNNLLVISSCCQSFKMLKSIGTFNQITPFNVLIAPATKVKFHFLKNEFINFVRSLIQTEDIYTSYEHIQDEYGVYVSPHILMSLLSPEFIQKTIDKSMLLLAPDKSSQKEVMNKVIFSKAQVFLAEKATQDLLDYLEKHIIEALNGTRNNI